MTSENKKKWFPAIPAALSRALQLLGGLGIAGAGLWIFFKDCDLSGLIAQIRAYHPAAVLLSVVMAILSIWLRAIRWKLILPATPGTNRNGLFGTTMIGFMVNNILPARLGEVARVVLLCRRNRYPAATAVGSLVLERGIDTLVFMSFFFIPVFTLPQLSGLRGYALPLATIVIVCVLFFIAYAIIPGPTRRIITALAVLLPGKLRTRFLKILTDVIANLDWVLSIRKVLPVIVLSFAIEFCYAAMMILLAQEFRTFGALEGMFSTAYAALGAAIPLAPGYVGTLHAFVLQGLTALGMDGSRARALAIVYHALGYLATTVLGLIIYFRTDITLSDISKARSQNSSVPNEPVAKEKS